MDGNDIHKEFPLRYRDHLADSFLNTARPEPKDRDLDDWHEWNQDNTKINKNAYKISVERTSR
jgi:hypothetical protein